MESDQHRDIVPRPPPARTTADFIVIIFVCMVAAVLGSLTLGAVLLALFTDDDVGPFIAILTDLMTTIISALVGFLAGRGVAASER